MTMNTVLSSSFNNNVYHWCWVLLSAASCTVIIWASTTTTKYYQSTWTLVIPKTVPHCQRWWVIGLVMAEQSQLLIVSPRWIESYRPWVRAGPARTRCEAIPEMNSCEANVGDWDGWTITSNVSMLLTHPNDGLHILHMSTYFYILHIYLYLYIMDPHPSIHH